MAGERSIAKAKRIRFYIFVVCSILCSVLLFVGPSSSTQKQHSNAHHEKHHSEEEPPGGLAAESAHAIHVGVDHSLPQGILASNHLLSAAAPAHVPQAENFNPDPPYCAPPSNFNPDPPPMYLQTYSSTVHSTEPSLPSPPPTPRFESKPLSAQESSDFST